MAGDVSTLPRLTPGVAVQEVDGDVLVFDGRTLSRLTGTAAEVVRLVDGTRSLRAIADATDLREEQVQHELENLESQGVVEPGAPAPVDGYRRPDHIAACPDREQIVLLDLRDGERHVLSPTASAIWQALTTTGSLSAAVTELERAFPGAPGLADDTERFVAALESQGLLERT